MKLSYEQKDALAPILLDNDTWDALIFLLQGIESSYKDRVLNYNLNSPLGDRGLTIEKAKAEGVTLFIEKFKIARDELVNQ